MARLSKRKERDSSLQDAMQTLISKYGGGDDTMIIVSPDATSKSRNTVTSLSDSSETRFTSEENIGSGGMKVIQLVKDENMKRTVAKASIHPSKLNEQNIEMFIREARLTAAMEHPHIIPIYDIGKNEKGEPYFIMKHLDGFNLKQLLVILENEDIEAKRNFPLRKLIRMFLEVCRAIAYAHKNKILHLDLKPDNIHISSNGKVYVVDWGLSRIIGESDEENATQVSELIDDSLDHTMSGQLKGTPGYMATEQILSKNKKLTPQTDVYGLGGILYSILSREIPVSESNLEDNLKQTLRGNISPPSKRRPDLKIDRFLERITMKAMSRLPKNRYASVQDLILDIEKFLNRRKLTKQTLTIPFLPLILSGFVLFCAIFIFYQIQRSSLPEENKEATKPMVSSPPPTPPPEPKVIVKVKKDIGTIVNSEHLIGWWKLDEQPGGIVTDYSRVGNVGQLKNMTQDIWKPGVFGEAIHFKFDKGFISIPYAKNFTEANMTVSLWVNLKSHKNWNRIMSYNWTKRQNGWIVMVNNKGKAIFALKNFSQIKTFSTQAVELETWQHIAGSYDGENLTVYLNGKKGSSNMLPLTFQGNGQIFLSADHGDFIDGALDDVRLYDEALPQEDIIKLYENGLKSLKQP